MPAETSIGEPRGTILFLKSLEALHLVGGTGGTGGTGEIGRTGAHATRKRAPKQFDPNLACASKTTCLYKQGEGLPRSAQDNCTNVFQPYHMLRKPEPRHYAGGTGSTGGTGGTGTTGGTG